MGLRPRTARRLVLVSVLLVIVVAGAVAFFTVPRFQKARQLEAFQRDGLAAHEDGRHQDAVMLLGRFIRGMGDRPFDPQIRAAYARSRYRLESSDGSHLAAAATVLREYFRDHPDDTQAGVDLLEMFVESGAWAEARELAVRLRPQDVAETPEERLPVLRNELRARSSLNADDPLIPELENRLLASPEPKFVDAWRAFARAEADSDTERAVRVIDDYAAARPNQAGPRVLSAIYATRGQPVDQSTAIICDAVGLDWRTGEWSSEAPLDEPELVRVLVRALELAGQDGLVTRVLSRAVEQTEDAGFVRMLVRRRYWSGFHDDVLSQEATTPGGAFVADVDGYAALVAMERGDDERVRALEARLREHSHDFRAQGWTHTITSRRAFRDGDFVAARAAASDAIERYPLEPTLRMLLGDVHERQGRLADAIDSWTHAEQLAEPTVWVDPGARQVTALSRAGRLPEAARKAEQLVQSTRGHFRAIDLLVHTDAMLARAGQLDADRARRSLAFGRSLRDALGQAEHHSLTLAIATIEASVGNADAARSELAALVKSEPGPDAMAEAVAVDQRFGLGLTAGPGLAELPDRIDDPEVALRAALLFASGGGFDQGRADRAGAMLDAGLSRAAPADKPRWLRTVAVFKDATRAPDAADAWRAAVAADPDSVDLLSEAVESDALGYDLDFVESSIARIVELTATQGRTLPSRLRLARAKAVFGKTPNRQRRDEALSTVRAVVLAEPQNLRARTMLANMLQHPCPPSMQGADRFSPDLTGAIGQYMEASRLVGGEDAFGYLFMAVDLHFRAGNENSARQLLLDIISRARDNPVNQQRVAAELNRLSDKSTAARLLGDLFASSTGPSRVTIGLQLAQSSVAANETRRAAEVLRQVAAAGDLDAEQVSELSRLFRQIGLADDADRVLEQAEQYGLTATEAGLVRARALARTGDSDAAERLLVSIVEADPQARDAWIALVSMLMAANDAQGAGAYADRALTHLPGDEDLLYWKRIATGDPAQAVRARLESADADPQARAAFERVERYNQRRDAMSREQRVAELRDMLEALQANRAAVKFVLAELGALGDDPARLAAESLAATRRFRSDEDLLRIAAELNLFAGRHSQARTIAENWRGVSQGSPLEADLYWSKAAEALGDHTAVIQRMAPYLQAALADPMEGFHPAVILAHSAASLATSATGPVRARLEPVAAAHPDFRGSVWLELAALHVPDASDAADWLRTAEQAGVDGRELALMNAWVTLAERFPDRGEAFALNAVRAGGERVSAQSDDLVLILSTAKAYETWASYLAHQDASEPYTRAETLYLRAAEIDPENLNHLFSAAINAGNAGRLAEAERHYRTLLARPESTGIFGAAVRNNLSIVLSEPSVNRADEALSLADEALRVRELAPFHGTRGWALLALSRPEEALAAFQNAVSLNPGSVDAWAGVAAARKATGADPGAVDEAIGRANSLSEGRRVSRQLAARLTAAGIAW